MLIIGSSVPETLPGSPGHIRAFDVNTGELRWIFHTIPQPGEFGYDTWPPDAHQDLGRRERLGGRDGRYRERGMVFAATGSASFDFYGVNRHGDNLFANCVLALDARTGKRIWHFQAVKHDLWDWDFPAAPNLVTVTRNGRKVDAVAQITKTGYVYVFDRRTGEPLFPIEYRKVPPSDVDGERAAATQPHPAEAAAVRASAADRGDADDAHARSARRRAGASSASAGRDSSRRRRSRARSSSPASTAAPNGAARRSIRRRRCSTSTRTRCRGSSQLIPSNDTAVYNSKCATCHRADRTGSPAAPSLRRHRRAAHARGDRRDHPRGHRPHAGLSRHGRAQHQRPRRLSDHRARTRRRSGGHERSRAGSSIEATATRCSSIPTAIPPITPPWGTLNAIDLNAGTIRWKIPFGEYPGARREGDRRTPAATTTAGPVVTAGGLLFIGATNFDKKFRAYDKLTGKLLWETTLPAAGNATPSIYMVNGRQYVVIACGGGKNGAPSGSTIVAFALPD